MSVLSEAEVMAGIAEGLPVAADTDDPRFRQYHIPGTGHGITGRVAHGMGAMSMPGAVTPADPRPDDPELCAYDRWNTPVISAIWRHIDRWVREDVPMPPGQHLERDPSAADGVRRDHYGNAMGGIRTPWVEAPNAQYFARSPGNPLAACYRPFTAAEMEAIYGDHNSYENAFRRKVAALIDAGWALPSDAGQFDP